MRFSSHLRTKLAGACHALGAVWAVAAVLRLVFGVAVTFPLLPPLDLERVQVLPAFAASLGLFLVGALLGRRRKDDVPMELEAHDRESLPQPQADQAPRTARMREPVHPVTKER